MAALEDVTPEDLRVAIDCGQLELHYQPKVLLANDRIAGVEALVRWRRPDGQLVPPERFISVAEVTGQIVAIGAWVIAEACRQAREWENSLRGGPPLVLSVNVAARQFGSDLVAMLADVLGSTGLQPALLCLEVTESTVMDDVVATISTLQQIKSLGVAVSIDDFGTGYSSLAYLKRFPIDELKIDRSFVDGLGREADNTAIVAAIVAMAHAMGLSVVAEGVETCEQLDRLRVLGCEQAQGYYFSRPVAAAELARLLVVETPSWARRPRAGHGGRSAYHGEVVVVADDAPEVLQLCEVSLAVEGFEVHTAEDGHAALEVARTVRPDCVILDVGMPVMDGFVTCLALRSDPVLWNCTIVLLTGKGDMEDKVEGFSAGADDYIVKPFTPRDLVSRVRAAIGRRQGGRPGGPAE